MVRTVCSSPAESIADIVWQTTTAALFCLALLAGPTSATPLMTQRPFHALTNETDRPDRPGKNGSLPWDPDEDEEMVALLNRFAPIIKLS